MKYKKKPGKNWPAYPPFPHGLREKKSSNKEKKFQIKSFLTTVSHLALTIFVSKNHGERKQQCGMKEEKLGTTQKLQRELKSS